MYQNKRAVSAEIFSSAVCNIECNYCYIPKVKEMKNIHKEIVSLLENNKYIEYLKNIYGDQLEALSFWGTEPTLTLPKVKLMIPVLFETFPKLKDISWSSNFITSPKVTVDFVNALPKDKKLKITIQASLDGPHDITDVNRAPGATDKITSNILEMITLFNDVDLGNNKIIFNSKPTWGSENIHYYLNDKSKLKEYYMFFENLIGQMHAINKNKNFIISFGANFSLAVPGRYTKQDGKSFSEVLDSMYEIEDEAFKNNTFKFINPETNTYEQRLSRILNYDYELITKPEMFTCSGGDSNYSVDNVGDFHICHRSLYLNNEEYINSVVENMKDTQWDISYFDVPSIDMVRKHWIVNHENDYEMARFSYITSGYHHFMKLKLSSAYATIRELAEVGQIDKIFIEDENMMVMFALFLTVAHSCPMENVLNTGVIHFTPISLFRLFGNGAFQKTLSKVIEKTKNGLGTNCKCR